MNAQIVANKLELLGLAVTSVSEPDFETDGMVEVSDRVHVQVPLSGNLLGVVRECEDGSFEFGALTTDIAVIGGEVAESLKLELAHQQGSSHGMKLG